MAGYIGSKSSVTQVDGYTEAEADAEFVNDPNGVITVSATGIDVTGETSAGSRLVLQDKSTGVEVNSSIRHHTNNYAYMFGGTNGLIFANNKGEDCRIKLQDSNEIEFITSSTNRMVIDSSGRVTTPYQPSFSARNASGFSMSSTIMKGFQTIQHNIGGHFNNSTGYFTAPVAGKYLVNAGVLISGGTGRLEFSVEVNSGSPYINGNGTGTDFDGPTASAVFNLSANDTIRVRLGSGTPYAGGNHPNTYFGVTSLG